MNRFRQDRARRIPAMILCLALFVVGSNYCLLSAWGGNSRMACLALPQAAAAASSSRCHHCTSPGDPSRQADTNAGRSCCPDPVVTPSTPSLDKQDAVAAATSAALLVVAPALSPLSTSAWHGRPALSDGQPPTRFARAPLSARAPPLA